MTSGQPSFREMATRLPGTLPSQGEVDVWIEMLKVGKRETQREESGVTARLESGVSTADNRICEERGADGWLLVLVCG